MIDVTTLFNINRSIDAFYSLVEVSMLKVEMWNPVFWLTLYNMLNILMVMASLKSQAIRGCIIKISHLKI